MKTKILLGWRWMLAVSNAVVLLGCLDQTRETSAQSVITEPAAQGVAASNTETDVAPERAIIPPANLSSGVAEVVKLAQSGVGEEVLLAYVEKSSRIFSPTVDEIVYLKDIGVSEAVVAAMVRQEKGSVSELAASKTAEEWQTNAPARLPESAAPSYSIAAEPAYNDTGATAPPQEVNINYFENTLSPYGSWVDVADYGRCWQPTVVVINRNWRPYSDRGRWVYTSSGWYWQSDYSWGWAPFHYGRWHCDSGIGWVWIPGSTWGPAWVSWRYTDEYCGWAPLPPTAYYDGFGFRFRNSRVGLSFDFGLRHDFYTFIPTSRFCERTPSRYFVSRSHSTTIYKNSVVINNYIRGNNNTIINEGIGRERITRATGKPLQSMALRELPATVNPIGKAERVEGNSLAVFRPNVSAQSSGRSLSSRTSGVGPVAQKSIAPSHGLRTIGKTETPSTKPQVPAPTVSVGSSEPIRKTFTRPTSPPIITREQQQAAVESSLKSETISRKNPTTSITTPRSNIGSSGVRNLPVQSSVQEHGRSIGRSEANSSQRETSRSITTQMPRERIASPSVTPVVPKVSQIQRTEPTSREIRRQDSSEHNFGSAQRSLRATTPSPVQSAPAPAQNYSSPSEISRGASRIERSVPQFNNQPSRSAPEPSVRQSQPRSAPAPSALRERGEKSAERSNRPDRNKS
ncbi:MAG: DUF6600 domain-containing protein [Verrucomicrobiota bacterium]